MDINFKCLQCGQKIVIDDTGAGLKVSCPACGTDLVVPAKMAVGPEPHSQPLIYTLRTPPAARREATTPLRDPLATPKQKSYLSQLGISLDEPTLTRSQASLLISQEERRLAKAVPATEKQKAFLADLGVKISDPSLCLEDASRLIDQSMATAPVTSMQIQKLKRPGYKDSVLGMSAEKAARIIGELECQPPTDEQYTIAHKQGLKFLKTRDFNAGRLDDILKCIDRPPSTELRERIASYGVKLVPKTEFEAKLLYELARTYTMCTPEQRHDACVAAMRDPEFYRPTLGSYCQIKWASQKRKEWFAAGKRPAPIYRKASEIPTLPAAAFSPSVRYGDPETAVVRKLKEGDLHP